MSEEKTKHEKKTLSHDEIERMVKEFFPDASSLCPGICREFQTYSDEYDEAVRDHNLVLQKRLLLVLKGISQQIKASNCKCYPT